MHEYGGIQSTIDKLNTESSIESSRDNLFRKTTIRRPVPINVTRMNQSKTP